MNRRDLLKASMSFGSVSLLAAGAALSASAPSMARAADGHAHHMMPASPALLAALADCIQHGLQGRVHKHKRMSASNGDGGQEGHGMLCVSKLLSVVAHAMCQWHVQIRRC